MVHQFQMSLRSLSVQLVLLYKVEELRKQLPRRRKKRKEKRKTHERFFCKNKT